MSSSLPRVLITGARGQLASALQYHPHAFAFTLIALSREELDITQPESIRNAIATHRPDIIINTAAYTAVDKAEDEIEKAVLINHIGAHELATACEAANILLFHISTDYVFDGSQQIPYTEENATTALNVYGRTKLMGEHAIQQSCKKHIILRVSGVFSEFGNNFAKSIIRLAREKDELRIVADQISCPTYAGDIAAAIYKIIAADDIIYGTYHFCSREPVSWHQFAVSIVAEAETFTPVKTQRILPITSAEYALRATRPAYSALNCEKILFTYGIEQPSTQKAIQTILSILPEKLDA